jgi:hypothetical protein
MQKISGPASFAGSSEVTALSVEFVARPQEAHRVQSAISAALSRGLQNVSGFAGCLVMTSEQEARLVTVITFWEGRDRLKQCRENTPWVHKLLAPYVDRCLRVQTLAAQLPELPRVAAEKGSKDEVPLKPSTASEDETACVA